jgi:ACS family glucarate transporter-like MFS transporter
MMPPRLGSGVPTKWWICSLFFGLTTAAYVQRTAISVAAAQIIPEQGLSQADIGWIEAAFLLTYTAFQYPSSVVGQKFGPRVALTFCFLVSLIATLAVPVAPAVSAGTALFALLIVAQLILGLMQAPLCGVGSGALERWFPARQWALVQGLMSAATGIGSAVTPIFVATVMELAGWRIAMAVLVIPIFGVVVLYWWYVRDDPRNHFAVTQEDLGELRPIPRASPPITLARMAQMIANRNVLLLATSYLCLNFVFYLIVYWSFLYLAQVRHFAILESGILTALPNLAGAAGAAIGGVISGRLVKRFGTRRGYRVLPLMALPLGGLILLVPVYASAAAIAVTGLCLSFGLVELTESCFWATAMEIGQDDTPAVSSILNMGGNMGGIVATPLVGVLSGHGDWVTPFIAGTCFAFLAAVLWIFIDADDRLAPPPSVIKLL